MGGADDGDAASGSGGTARLEKSYFDVLGLCCSSEVPLIEKILTSLPGVTDYSIIVPTKTVIVIHDPLLLSQLQIVKALNQARLEANVKARGGRKYRKRFPSPYAVICGTLLLLSFLKYLYSPLKWLAVGSIAVGIIPIFLKATASARNLNLDINILVLIAVSGSVALHDYWEAATIVFMFSIAEWLESRASHKATSVMSSLVDVVPQRATLAYTGEEVNADEVKLNTILAVKTGETIPIDGVVVEGNCEVDEKILTGESFPVAKEKDSLVWASTINLNGYISIKTTAVVEDCIVARMAKLVEDAQNNKSRTQRLLDKCAKYYTPAIVVISASLAAVPLVFGVKNKREWYHLALVVLVSGCPCALLLSTPVAMFCALSKAATLGLLIKGAEHLETLAGIKIMAFDKTGTITRGEFFVADVRSLRADVSLNTLLYWISSIESKSSHPMAAALIDFARDHGIEPKPDKVEQFQNFPGEGICGRVDGNEIHVGSWKIASRAGSAQAPDLEGCGFEGKSVGYVFQGSSLAGVFCLSDACRTGAKEAINQLKLMGIKSVMLTGDSHAAAQHAQAQLGGCLEAIRSELLPEDKARIVTELQNKGPTAMVGDGVNDAPALATADIGISMGVSGSALATESGDIVLMSNDIQRIPKAVMIAKKVRRKIIENVIISISTKAAIVGLAIAGHPLVWAAVLTDVGTCLLVIFNSMLLLQGTHSSGKKICLSTTHLHSRRHEGKTPNPSSHTHGSCRNKGNTRTCSSKMCASKYGASCATKKVSTFIDEKGCNTQCHSHDQTKAVDQKCCGKMVQDLESQIVHKHGCSENAVESGACCGNNSCSITADEQRYVEVTQRLEPVSVHSHGCSDHACNPHTIAMALDFQSQGKAAQDLESGTVHRQGCSETATLNEENDCLTTSPAQHGCGNEDGMFHKTQKCENGNHGISSSKKAPPPPPLLPVSHGHKPSHHDHKHDEKSCMHTPRKRQCNQSKCEHGASGNAKQLSSPVSILAYEACVDSSSTGGQCCDSLRRECCNNKGDPATDFNGGLSKIVVE